MKSYYFGLFANCIQGMPYFSRNLRPCMARQGSDTTARY